MTLGKRFASTEYQLSRDTNRKHYMHPSESDGCKLMLNSLRRVWNSPFGMVGRALVTLWAIV